MGPEPLSPLDATFLNVEDRVSHMHVGSLFVVDGPAPPYADVVALIAAKLPRLPRYRQHVKVPDGVAGVELLGAVLDPFPVAAPPPAAPEANRITAMFAELPVGADDPAERLRLVSAQMGRLKESGQALAAASLVGWPASPRRSSWAQRPAAAPARPASGRPQRAGVGIMSQALARACGSVSRR